MFLSSVGRVVIGREYERQENENCQDMANGGLPISGTGCPVVDNYLVWID